MALAGNEVGAPWPPAGGVPVRETGEMPVWLNQAAQPTLMQRFGRTGLVLGVAALVIGGGAAGSMWLLQEHKAGSALELAALGAQADVPASTASPAQAASALSRVPEPSPFIERRATTGVPPLVLLDTPGGAAPKEATVPAEPVTTDRQSALPVARAPATAPATAPAPAPAPAVASKTVPVPAPVGSGNHAVPASPAHAATPKTAMAQAPKAGLTHLPKAAPAAKNSASAEARPRLASPKKPRLAKASTRSRRVDGIMLPPPRERTRYSADRVPRQPKRCAPGQLARECVQDHF